MTDQKTLKTFIVNMAWSYYGAYIFLDWKEHRIEYKPKRYFYYNLN